MKRIRVPGNGEYRHGWFDGYGEATKWFIERRRQLWEWLSLNCLPREAIAFMQHIDRICLDIGVKGDFVLLVLSSSLGLLFQVNGAPEQVPIGINYISGHKILDYGHILLYLDEAI